MSESQTFLNALVEAIQAASAFNKNHHTEPVVILWPDKERQWEGIIPTLRERLPILTYDHDHYVPTERRGPAYWLRCMLARSLPHDMLPEKPVPIIYLPGVSKSDLRAVEECPKPLQPLAELQHRGVLWTQRNGRDWTIASFLQNKEGGLGVSVGTDTATKEAMSQALSKLTLEPVTRLHLAAPLKAPFFLELLNPDAVRRLLLWLNQPTEYPKQLSQGEWHSFCTLCQQKYGFHPEQDGPVTAAQLLGAQKGEWVVVWDRFLEAPEAYPHLQGWLAQARPVQLSLFAEPSPYWPQDTTTAEAKLREQLKALRQQGPHEARAALIILEQEHGSRRTWVWAQLGQAPLTMALESLITLAQLTEKTLAGSSLVELAQAYTTWGWQADAAVLAALAAVTKSDDVVAVKAAILPLYRPWLDAAATIMQKLVNDDVAAAKALAKPVAAAKGTCLLFCDALRFDQAKQLQARLNQSGFTTDIKWQMAALPTVTATAKPAISPVASQMIGSQPGLVPAIGPQGTNVNALNHRKLLTEAGYQILPGDELGDPTGRGWVELGAIDQYGHQHGWKIAHHSHGELNTLVERVDSLLSAGWKQVVLITDHGWLLLPDGLPKIELPQHLTLIRKGRCAVLKDGASTDQQVIPWHWNAEVRIGVAPGIGSYEAGKEYEHGGLSPQECLVPVLSVRQTSTVGDSIAITEVAWRGLRCHIKLAGDATHFLVDIRTKAGDASTSLTTAPKYGDASGKLSLVIPDEEREGSAALVVVLSGKGTVLAQRSTIIGEA